MNVLLIDDHEIVWSGTQGLLERLAREIDPQAPFGFQAVRDVASACGLPAHGFDLVLLDYHLPDLSGLAALQAVKAHFEAVPVCIQSAETSAPRMREVIEAGAAGFVPKSYRLEEIEAALRVVLRHRIYLPAEFLLSQGLTRRSEPDEPALASEDLPQFLRSELSPRQRQVLALAVRGVPTKLISRQLGIAEGTVKVHLSMVYRALGARNRTDALCRVFEAQASAALEAP
jgi:two-component system, NarL family, nitrate/nitrite response regulator NarL